MLLVSMVFRNRFACRCSQRKPLRSIDHSAPISTCLSCHTMSDFCLCWFPLCLFPSVRSQHISASVTCFMSGSFDSLFSSFRFLSIYLPLPDEETRLELMTKLLKNQNHTLSSSDFDKLVAKTEGAFCRRITESRFSHTVNSFASFVLLFSIEPRQYVCNRLFCCSLSNAP